MNVVATPRTPNARDKLLDAAVDVIRAQGFTATSVDDLCAAAGVSKGAFFHHFESKEALGVAAADHWSDTTGALFATAEYHELSDPVDRVLGYVDFRAALIDGPIAEFTCLVGTMAQETFSTDPAIRDACGASILGHAATLEDDLTAALTANGSADPDVEAHSLAIHTQVVLQGAFVVAKASNDAQIAVDSIAHLRHYLEMRLGPSDRHRRTDQFIAKRVPQEGP